MRLLCSGEFRSIFSCAVAVYQLALLCGSLAPGFFLFNSWFASSCNFPYARATFSSLRGFAPLRFFGKRDCVPRLPKALQAVSVWSSVIVKEKPEHCKYDVFRCRPLKSPDAPSANVVSKIAEAPQSSVAKLGRSWVMREVFVWKPYFDTLQNFAFCFPSRFYLPRNIEERIEEHVSIPEILKRYGLPALFFHFLVWVSTLAGCYLFLSVNTGILELLPAELQQRISGCLKNLRLRTSVDNLEPTSSNCMMEKWYQPLWIWFGSTSLYRWGGGSQIGYAAAALGAAEVLGRERDDLRRDNANPNLLSRDTDPKVWKYTGSSGRAKPRVQNATRHVSVPSVGPARLALTVTAAPTASRVARQFEWFRRTEQEIVPRKPWPITTSPGGLSNKGLCFSPMDVNCNIYISISISIYIYICNGGKEWTWWTVFFGNLFSDKLILQRL